MSESKTILFFRSLIVVVFVCCAMAADWNEFRGPKGNPVVKDAKIPLQWSETKNVAWKAKIPGRGPSSPIIVGNKIIVTSNSGVNQTKLHVLCYDVSSGKQQWERTFWATGRTLCHPSSSMAAPTPASDGKLIFAFFASNDLACLDLDGNLKWYRGLTHDYPQAANDVGMSSSPVVSGQTVIVQIENQGNSFAAGINTKTGETRWRVPRDRKATWSSPAVIRAKNVKDDVVVVQSGSGLTAYNALSGKKLWSHKESCAGIASTTVVDNTVYIPSQGITAIATSAGKRKTEVLWKNTKLASTSCSPVIHDGLIYTVNRTILVCGDIKTGSMKWRLRLPTGRYWATPVLAGKHLFIVAQNGETQVIELSKKSKGKLINKNSIGETIHGTPAIVGDCIIIRSDDHLWKISKKK